MDITKRKRQQRGRSKLGCQRCRSRHIKCDETWPRCLNCIRAKFECSGKPNAKIQVPIAIQSHADRRQAERDTFRHYVTDLAPAMPGIPNQDFWGYSICLAGQSHPAIYNAVIGLSTLFHLPHEHILDPSGVPTEIRNRYQQAIQWYSNSVTACVKSQSSLESVTVLLLSSILHAYTEVRLGHLSNAKDLVKVAFALVNSYRSRILRFPNITILSSLFQLFPLIMTYAIDAAEIPQEHIHNTIILAVAMNTRLGPIEAYENLLEVSNFAIRINEALDGDPTSEADIDQCLMDFREKWILRSDKQYPYLQYHWSCVQWHVYKHGFSYQRKSLEVRLTQVLEVIKAVSSINSHHAWSKLPWAFDLYLAPMCIFVAWFWREQEILDTISNALRALYKARVLYHRLIAYIGALITTPYNKATYLELKLFGPQPKVLKFSQMSIIVSHLMTATERELEEWGVFPPGKH